MAKQWLNTSEYPFRSNYMDINGYQLHYIDEGQGDILLFVHGTPSWSYDFRNIIKEMKQHYRCIALDHIGFGLSDKPEHYDYSTQNHSRTLENFISRKNLSNINLVVHDFGGPIGLNFAIQHPEKISRIAVINSWLWSSEADPDFQKLKRVLKSPLLPVLYRFFNFSPRVVLPKSFGDKKLSKAQLSQYTQPFANHTQRNGALSFAKSLVVDQGWFEELWHQRHILADKPILLLWGMKDPVVKSHNLLKFQEGFSQSKTVQFETAGHFPQEEQPQKMIEALLNFMESDKHTLKRG